MIRENELFTYPIDEATRKFTEDLGRRRDMGLAAKVVVSQALGRVRCKYDTDPGTGDIRFGVEIMFTGPNGSELDPYLFTHRVNHQEFRKPESRGEAMSHLVKTAIFETSKDDNLLAKLVLLNADTIEALNAGIVISDKRSPSVTKSSFNRELWSRKIIAGYREECMAKALKPTNPNAVIGTVYDEPITAGMKYALEILFQCDPTLREKTYEC